jgi:hypothetical protein
MTEEKKTCNICKLDFPKTNEYFHYHSKSEKAVYFASYCKTCHSARAKKYRQENKQKVTAQKRVYLSNPENRAKANAANRKFYQLNKKDLLEAQKKYYEENKEEILKKTKERRSTIEAKRKRRQYENKKRNENPSFKMKKNVSAMIRHYLKNNKGTKKNSTWTALPYSPQQLREHLESQFEDWMTWENYGNGEGKWNIDHIHPQSLLPYNNLEHPNFLKCWALDNLRPLCSSKNSSKGNRLDY